MATRTTIMQRNNVRVLGDGPETIIFAHGFGSDQNAWQHQVAEFASKYHIVLFDHVGGGQSDLSAYSPRRYSSLYSYAEDLLDLCAELKLTQCILVGHSLSGMVSLLAALLEPERFSQLIIIGASPRYLNDEGYIGGFEQHELDALYEAMSSNYHAWALGFAPLFMQNPDKPELAVNFSQTLAAVRPDIALSVARMVYQSDHRTDLPKVKVPVAILQSNDDIVVPQEVGHYMEKNIPQSKLLQLPTSGHLPHLSSPNVVNRAIAQCLVA
ncbi:MAG TPA: alpha/beta hydrolase [Waterburya sp.]